MIASQIFLEVDFIVVGRLHAHEVLISLDEASVSFVLVVLFVLFFLSVVAGQPLLSQRLDYHSSNRGCHNDRNNCDCQDTEAKYLLLF